MSLRNSIGEEPLIQTFDSLKDSDAKLDAAYSYEFGEWGMNVWGYFHLYS